MPAVYAFTVRLPEPVYKAARRIAKRQGISLNRLIQKAIAGQARSATSARLSAAYEVLASDRSEADVSSLLAVQAEAILDD